MMATHFTRFALLDEPKGYLTTLHAERQEEMPTNTLTTMVNYSLVLRSVNTNLIEINQAKARIKAAKAQGTTPKTEDTDLVKTEQQKVFAVAQYSEVMDLTKFSKPLSLIHI